jgi:hypothetical protein
MSIQAKVQHASMQRRGAIDVQNLRVENATGGEPSIMQVPNLDSP